MLLLLSYCEYFYFFFFKNFDENFLIGINVAEQSFFQRFLRTSGEQFLFVDVSIFILFVAILSYVCGIGTILNNRLNYFWNLLSLEIVFVSVAIFFIALGQYFNLAFFYLCSVIVITFSGIDAALGLVILVKMYKFSHTLDFDRPFVF